jgi:hypothetical protein
MAALRVRHERKTATISLVSMGSWDDYNAMRPGTLGGNTARDEFKRAITPPSFSPPKPEIPDIPVGQPPPPRVKRQLTKIDFVIGAVVFLVTWMMLASSSSMDGGTAFVFAFFASAIAGMWWRTLVFIALAVAC